MDLSETSVNFKIDLIHVCMQKPIAITQTDPEHKQETDGQTTETDGQILGSGTFSGITL